MKVNIIDPVKQTISTALMEERNGGVVLLPLRDAENEAWPYLSPGWIDLHCHVFHGTTSFGICPDQIGYSHGVHMLVDAGSSGAETSLGFTEYVVKRNRTPVKAFLNISDIGLVTMQEYADMRRCSAERAISCFEANREFYVGIKVRSSHLIVEDKGILPLQRALRASRALKCPLMVHMGEMPPSNEEILQYLGQGDIISHCFHGKCEPLWEEDGTPIPALEKALERGVLLDTAHGAASYSHRVALAAIKNGFRNFIISTDLHQRSINSPVYSLAHTMGKLYAAGLTKMELINSVTVLPAKAIGLYNWGDCLEQEATLFYLRPRKEDDAPFTDASGCEIPVGQVIEPFANIICGHLEYIRPSVKETTA